MAPPHPSVDAGAFGRRPTDGVEDDRDEWEDMLPGSPSAGIGDISGPPSDDDPGSASEGKLLKDAALGTNNKTAAENRRRRRSAKQQQHRQKLADGPRLWNSLVTETLGRRDPRAHSNEALAAVAKELKNLRAQVVWDEYEVYEEAVAKQKYPNGHFARIFAIVGIKNAEADDPEEWEWKGRVVFGGDNVKTGGGGLGHLRRCWHSPDHNVRVSCASGVFRPAAGQSACAVRLFASLCPS